MTDKKSSKLPVEINFQDGSLFDPILDEFDTDSSLYNQVMNKIDPEVFENLPREEKGRIAGLTFIDGGIYEKKLTVAGRTSVSNDLYTKNLSAAGSTTFNGSLGVSDDAKFAGRVKIRENGLFGGDVKIAGQVNFDQNLVVSGSLKIAGRANVAEYLLADAPVRIEGNLSADSVRSNSVLHLRGKLFVAKDVIAKEVITDGITGVVEGNLYAKTIKDQYVAKKMEKDLSTVGGVLSYIKNTLSRIFTNRMNRGLIIQGDVIADEIEMDNITIQGNIYAKNVSIGENTTIGGTIYYLEEINLPQHHNFKVIQGFPDQLGEGNKDT